MITLHIIAEGHLLDMGVTMKGYPAVIVDIIGFLSKKEKNIYGEYAVGHPVTTASWQHSTYYKDIRS